MSFINEKKLEWLLQDKLFATLLLSVSQNPKYLENEKVTDYIRNLFPDLESIILEKNDKNNLFDFYLDTIQGTESLELILKKNILNMKEYEFLDERQVIRNFDKFQLIQTAECDNILKTYSYIKKIKPKKKELIYFINNINEIPNDLVANIVKRNDLLDNSFFYKNKGLLVTKLQEVYCKYTFNENHFNDQFDFSLDTVQGAASLELSLNKNSLNMKEYKFLDEHQVHRDFNKLMFMQTIEYDDILKTYSCIKKLKPKKEEPIYFINNVNDILNNWVVNIEKKKSSLTTVLKNLIINNYKNDNNYYNYMYWNIIKNAIFNKIQELYHGSLYQNRSKQVYINKKNFFNLSFSTCNLDKKNNRVKKNELIKNIRNSVNIEDDYKTIIFNLIEYTSSQKPENLKYIFYYNLCEKTKSTPETLLKALYIMSENNWSIFDIRFEFIEDDDSAPIEIPSEDIIQARFNNCFYHPNTSKQVINFQEKIFTYFSLSKFGEGIICE